MKKLSLIIALVLCVTIGSVYATWVYSKTNDVADITGARAITMTDATFEGGLGTYHISTAGLTLKVDPKEGTSHNTSLVADGAIEVTFTPSVYAEETIKNNAVGTEITFAPSKDVTEWVYDGKQVFDSIDSTPITVDWNGTKQADGSFKYLIPASVVLEKLHLNETIVLDTKADYDAYDGILTQAQIVVSITDGNTSSASN